MEQNLSKTFTSKKTVLTSFGFVALLLTIPLALLMAGQRADLRGKAAEPTPKIAPPTQGIGSIGGYVFHDANKDGERDVEEKPFAGVKIALTQIRQNLPSKDDRTVDVVSHATTDSNGYFKFRFSNLRPGSITYMVKVILPSDYKTIDTNPVIFTDLRKDTKEIIEFGLFPLFDKIVSATPSPTCTVRPVCLDNKPKCLIAEPAKGWCPQTTVKPSPSVHPTKKPFPTKKPQ